MRSPSFPWNAPTIKKLVDLAIVEDRSLTDVTSHLLIEPQWRAEAVLIAMQGGVIAGLPFVEKVFKALDRTGSFESCVRDGARVRKGKILARIRAKARSILAAERPALNTLQHLSGVATYTYLQVQKLHDTTTRLYDTRKTLPGWRMLQKYAVQCGGGFNHRLSLAHGILIKDNHLKIVRLAGTDWQAKVARMMRRRPALPIQVEVETEQDLQEVIRLKPQLVLLDNLTPAKLQHMIAELRRHIPGIQIEISGGIKGKDLPTLGRLGAERISMGRLTHSAPAFDCSLEIQKVYAR
jgi:nicotinate-nucleotide pyrophosphorylase (carboxylating)